MKIIKLANLLDEKKDIIAALLDGAVAILPTDTIYGLSGNGESTTVVKRILAIKERLKPFSLIPPTSEYAEKIIAAPPSVEIKATLHRFRGPFTMLWPVRPDLSCISRLLYPEGIVALRLPNHFVLDLANEAGIPLTSTSVNRSGFPAMTSLDDLDPSIAQMVDFFLDAGPLQCHPSTLVRCDLVPPKIVAR